MLSGCSGEPKYYNGHIKYTINDTIVIDFNGTGHISGSKFPEQEPLNPSYPNYYYDLKIGCNQFDTSATYNGEIYFWSTSAIQPHSTYTFTGYNTTTNYARFTVFHPQVGGFYSSANSTITIYINELNPNRMNGYFYGDFYKPSDSTTAYVTCDFDFIP